jgi:16S rRNA (guanine527-N7)-methyltransferase
LSEPAPFEADPAQIERLMPMLEMLEHDPASLSSVTDPARALEVHVLDSLSGTVVSELDDPVSVVDIGSGAGFPGIPLALARPGAGFDLVDSVGRKVDFIQRVADRLGLPNVTAVHARSEELAGSRGREGYRVATARAVAPLVALAELASPLLEAGGSLVAWKGNRDPAEEGGLSAASRRVAMEIDRVVPVKPFAASRTRHLYVLKKTGPTPPDLPRRPGMARKRPLTG